MNFSILKLSAKNTAMKMTKPQLGFYWRSCHKYNQEQFGVVQLDNTGAISALVEKPRDFVSDLAWIWIYAYTRRLF